MNLSTQPQTRQGRPSRRLVRREALLAEAVRQLNASGAGALSLRSVAEGAGLSRNALYYYFRNPAEIVAACYLDACGSVMRDLDCARALAGDPAETLKAFVERALRGEEVHAVVTDLAFLPEALQPAIAVAQAEALAGIAALFDDGVQAGRFRAVDPLIAAQATLGMLNWARLSAMWLGHRADAAWRATAAAAIIELVLHGISAEAAVGNPPRVSLLEAVPHRSNLFDRSQVFVEKEDQILAAASWLFNRQGIDGTTIDDICARLRVTKGVVYHYFVDKTALVVRAYERSFHLFDRLMSHAEEQPLCGRDRAAMVFDLNCQAQLSDSPPLGLQAGLFALPRQDVNRFVRASQALAARSDALLSAGLKDGSCRKMHARAISEVSAGAFLWLAKWPNSVADPSECARRMTNIMVLGSAAVRRTVPPS